jgi:pyruvate dehydrogenase E1 component alpha subunit
MRRFEETCRDGVASGEIHGELHVSIGLEAIAAGMAESLRLSDALVSTHRCHLHAIAKGVSLELMLAEIFERETGLCRGRGGHMHLFDPARSFSTTGIVGQSLPVALGYAYAFWMEGKDDIGVGVTGDAGANAGTFHECLNIAGAWKLPFVLLVENNGFGISVPIDAVTATPTIAERGAAYGAWWRQVDGTDVDAVAQGFAAAVAHARSGAGPALLEATAYRFAGHYEGDYDLYRSREYKEAMLESDPLVVTARKLQAHGVASEAELEAIEHEAHQELLVVMERVRAAPFPAASDARRYVFVEDTS